MTSKLGALERFRMGSRWPERPSMIKDLALAASFPHSMEREEGLEIELVIDNTYMM